MTYLRPFHRLVVSGSLYTDEAFSWGLSIIPEDNINGTRFSSVPQGVIDAITAFWQTAQVTSSLAKIKTIKLNQIGEDGKYVSQTDTVQHDFATPLGGVAGYIMPPQVSVAVSLRTPAARGRAHAGRFYIPAPGVTPGLDAMMDAAGQLVYANAAKTLLNSLNASLSTHRIGVVSNLGTGAEQPVTSVAVGRVYDTIRSRRASLPESYLETVDLDPV